MISDESVKMCLNYQKFEFYTFFINREVEAKQIFLELTLKSGYLEVFIYLKRGMIIFSKRIAYQIPNNQFAHFLPCFLFSILITLI